MPFAPRPRIAAGLAATAVLVLGLGACGNTLQDQPISRSALEPMVLEQHYAVYWLGGAFRGLAITETAHDPGGAYTLHYGDCTRGGQYTCVSPLTIVTSPDNSFVPGYRPGRASVALRGARGVLTQGGASIAIPTGEVVVSVFAQTPALALAAAYTMVPINRVAVPGGPLPPRVPDTGFAAKPLPGQEPRTVVIPSAAGLGNLSR